MFFFHSLCTVVDLQNLEVLPITHFLLHLIPRNNKRWRQSNEGSYLGVGPGTASQCGSAYNPIQWTRRHKNCPGAVTAWPDTAGRGRLHAFYSPHAKLMHKNIFSPQNLMKLTFSYLDFKSWASTRCKLQEKLRTSLTSLSEVMAWFI